MTDDDYALLHDRELALHLFYVEYEALDGTKWLSQWQGPPDTTITFSGRTFEWAGFKDGSEDEELVSRYREWARPPYTKTSA